MRQLTWHSRAMGKIRLLGQVTLDCLPCTIRLLSGLTTIASLARLNVTTGEIK